MLTLPNRPRWPIFISGVAVLLLTLALSLFAIESEDLPMYLAIARRMLAAGGLPATDPFLYPIENYEWYIAHQWLSYLFFFAAFSLAGWMGVIITKAVLVLLLPLTVFALAQRAQRPPLLVVAVTLLSLGASVWRLVERTALFSDLFSLALLFVLIDKRLRESRWLYAIPVMFLLWVNLHPGFPIGLAFLLAAWSTCRLTGRLTKSRLGLVTALSFLACLLNPRGMYGLFYPFSFAFNEARVFKDHYLEWLPFYTPSFLTTVPAWSFIVLVITVALLLASRWTERREPRELPLPWFPTVIAIIVTAQAISGIRFVPGAAFCLALLIVHLLPKTDSPPPRLVAAVAMLIGALAMTVALQGYHSLGWKRTLSFTLNPQAFPIANSDVIETLPADWRLFNNHDFGGYLAWRWDGKRQIFYHGFVTDTDFYQNEFLRIARSQQDFKNIVNKYNLRIILVDKTQGYPVFKALLRNAPEWRLMGADQVSVLWVRPNSAP